MVQLTENNEKTKKFIGLVTGIDKFLTRSHGPMIWAVIWDFDKVKTTVEKVHDEEKEIYNTYSIDASEEIQELVRMQEKIAYTKADIESDIKNSKIPRKGTLVKVARGRNNKGVIGKIFWEGGEWNKIGIALDDERDEKGGYKNVVWDYLKNADVFFEEYNRKYNHTNLLADIKVWSRDLKEQSDSLRYKYTK